MRFAKQKGGAGALEAHHERTKEKYASNPDVDTTRSKYNFHIVKPTKSYLQETNGRIEAAGCKTRKDSVRFVDTLITASPDFFKGKKREEVKTFFQTAVDFLSRKIGKDNIFAATVHMDEKTPHMHLCFTPITEDGRLSAKEISWAKIPPPLFCLFGLPFFPWASGLGLRALLHTIGKEIVVEMKQ